MYYVLEAYDPPGSKEINAKWFYATTEAFPSAAEAALWTSNKMIKDVLEGRCLAYKIEPAPAKKDTQMTTVMLDHSREVLATRPLNRDEEVILCKIKNPSGHPYATWKRRIGEGATYFGCYFMTEEQARRNFNMRN